MPNNSRRSIHLDLSNRNGQKRLKVLVIAALEAGSLMRIRIAVDHLNPTFPTHVVPGKPKEADMPIGVPGRPYKSYKKNQLTVMKRYFP